MFRKYLVNHKTDILIILSLSVIVGLLQIILFNPQLDFGFTPDDWWPLMHYKYLDSNVLENLLQIWKNEGVYTTYQVIYISILHIFFDFNFQAYQITNLILKSLSALFLYPLILIVFKNRLLAFIAVALYAMAYSPLGTLEIVVRGSDFIGIIFMCIFFIAYHQAVNKGTKSILRLGVVSLLLLLSMIFSPIRQYPVLAFIILIEAYLCLTQRSRLFILNSFRRVVFIFAPYLLLIAWSSDSVLNYTSGNSTEIIKRIFLGNWQLLLYPLGSLGSLFVFNDYSKIFGTIQIRNFIGYFSYVVSNTLVVFSIITLFYSFIISVTRRRLVGFLFKVLVINLGLQIIIYLVAKHRESISENLRMGYDYAELYPVLFAVFILALVFAIWQEWIYTGKKNNFLLALWIGPVFAILHIFLTWIFKDYSVLFKGVHTYLNIPSIGINLFISATLVLFYLRIRNSFGKLGKQLASSIFLLLIPIFIMNQDKINTYWNWTSYGMNAREHEAVRSGVWSRLTDFDNSRPSLFYFDALEDYQNGRLYEQSMLGRFSEWMFFQGSFPPGSCNLPVYINSRPELLKEKMIQKDGEIGFYHVDYCGRETFYSIQQFYAFKLINKKSIDIKAEILEKLKK